LEVDFYLPRLRVAVEYDERQHFTAELSLTLEFYDTKLFPFAVQRWSKLCSDSIIDSAPPCRDWQRAFRDTVRDFRALSNGIKLIRIYYRDFDISTLADEKAVNKLADLMKI
jgi:hypothetical protein